MARASFCARQNRSVMARTASRDVAGERRAREPIEREQQKRAAPQGVHVKKPSRSAHGGRGAPLFWLALEHALPNFRS